MESKNPLNWVIKIQDSTKKLNQNSDSCNQFIQALRQVLFAF